MAAGWRSMPATSNATSGCWAACTSRCCEPSSPTVTGWLGSPSSTVKPRSPAYPESCWRCSPNAPIRSTTRWPSRWASSVAAKAGIYRLVRELADAGKAVIFVSGELEELPLVCDRVITITGGQVTAEFIGHDVTVDAVLSAAMAA